MAKLGERDLLGRTPAPAQAPRTSWVFPAPRSPTSATTSPGASSRAEPRAERVRRARRARDEPRRVPLASPAPLRPDRADRLAEVARDEPALAEPPRGEVARRARGRTPPTRPAAGGGRPPARSAPHRPASTSPVPPVARPGFPVGTTAGGALGIGDDGARALQHHGRAPRPRLRRRRSPIRSACTVVDRRRRRAAPSRRGAA